MDLGRDSVPSLLADMGTGLLRNVIPSLHGHTSFARRMRLHSVLSGHAGCVNRLALSTDGTLLLSGSDDCTLRIWTLDPPDGIRPRGVVTPGHYTNIFGVAFMPDTDNKYVASAGLDCEVRHTHVATSNSTLWNCHSRQVKTVAPLDAHTFITASRDGTACLIDTRQPPTVPVPIVAAISHGAQRFCSLSSALPSPVFSNHLLVAGGDPYMRIFDLRLPPSITSSNSRTYSASSPSSNPRPAPSFIRSRHEADSLICIEKYCPPHYHSSSPERLSSYPFLNINCTFANYSPDGTQIVASYFNDTVTVFDRPGHIRSQRRTPGCLNIPSASPFRSPSHRSSTIWKFTLQTAHYLRQQHHPSALSSANRVLELDPDNIFILACKSIALIGRQQLGDLRTAYASLAHLLSLLDVDGASIATLFGWTDVTGTPRQPQHDDAWRDRLDIWRPILQFVQMDCLFLLLPILDPTSVNLYGFCDSELLQRRLEYLDKTCAQLELYRQRRFPAYADDFEAWVRYVRQRALGSPKEVESLYGSECGTTRRMILNSLVDRFITGLDARRSRLREKMRVVIPQDAVGSTEPTEAADSLGSASYDGDREDDGDGEDDDEEIIDEYDDEDDDDNDVEDNIVVDREIADNRIPRSSNTTSRPSRARPTIACKVDMSEEEEMTSLWGPLTPQPNCRSFHGHTSEKTDIKEANFFGSRGQVVLSGSDDGHVYMWSATTGQLLSRISADEQIVNCVLPHPHHSMVIASGIDSTIKVLLPGPTEN